MGNQIYHTDSQNNAGVTILVSDKVDFKSNNITTDKDDHFLVIKG